MKIEELTWKQRLPALTFNLSEPCHDLNTVCSAEIQPVSTSSSRFSSLLYNAQAKLSVKQYLCKILCTPQWWLSSPVSTKMPWDTGEAIKRNPTSTSVNVMGCSVSSLCSIEAKQTRNRSKLILKPVLGQQKFHISQMTYTKRVYTMAMLITSLGFREMSDFSFTDFMVAWSHYSKQLHIFPFHVLSWSNRALH